MMLAIILLALLFLFGLINTFLYIPPNKFFVWIQSYFPKNYFPKNTITHHVTSTSSSKVVLEKEDMEAEEKKRKKGKSFSSSNGGLTYDNDHRKAELERVFATFDKNGDGFITKQELGETLRNIGFFTSENEVGSMVGNLDVNGDGLIDIDEFYELYESIMGKRSEKGENGEDGVEVEVDEEEELRDAFDVFDGDKDGLISVEELGIVLKSLGLKQGIRVEECKEMIRKVDLDGDGMVSFDEFKMMMKSGLNLVQVS